MAMALCGVSLLTLFWKDKKESGAESPHSERREMAILICMPQAREMASRLSARTPLLFLGLIQINRSGAPPAAKSYCGQAKTPHCQRRWFGCMMQRVSLLG